MHWWRFAEFPECSRPGCTNRARSASGDVVCVTHYRRFRIYGTYDLLPAACAGCGTEVGARSQGVRMKRWCPTCWASINVERHRKATGYYERRINNPCELCGAEIPVGTAKSARWRCDNCKESRKRATASFHHHVRRTTYRDGDRISIRELGDRDGWVCHLCGEPVRKRGGQDGLAPTIDHLEPVSVGGPHVWSNVALAHKACNVRRGNRPLTQHQ